MKIAVLTGAGISRESGLATFRDSDGLWHGFRPEEVATPEAWERNPALVLHFYNERRRQVAAAHPNEAHKALAKLEAKHQVFILTQNVDDLHERAGSSWVLHLHGEIFKARSTKDPSIVIPIKGDIKIGDTCPLGSQLRPHIVWFGEPVPAIDQALKIVKESEVFLVIGTSLAVYPAAGLIEAAPDSAKKYIIDPKIPSIPSYVLNVNKVPEPAAIGVVKVVNKLLREEDSCY